MHAYFQYFCAGLFIAMIIVQGFAYLYANSRKEKVWLFQGGAVEAAVFALLGLLMAFTFANAQNRFEIRRQLIIDEVNAISTAFLRIDTLSKQDQESIKKKFIEYVDSRINFFPKLINKDEVLAELAQTEKLQRQIWGMTIASLSNNKESSATVIVLPALNQMFDIVSTRTFAAQAHTSKWIFFIFTYIALICSIFAGFRMAEQASFNWYQATIFSLAISVTLLMIFDIEFPRYGFIQLDEAQSALVDLKKSMVEYN